MPFPTWAIFLLGLPLSSAALSLSGNYTPTHIQCPAGETFVRNASHSLSTEETAWLEKRRPNVVRALESYLSNVGIEGFNVSEYISALNNTPHGVPTIGLTWSGGGTRAQSSDYGQMYSFDGRVSAAVNARTGGLLQATTYVAGLSGGATGLGPVAMADFQNIEDMFQEGLLSVNFSSNAFNEMLGKAKQGFNLSVSDIYAIALGANTLKIPGNDTVDPLSRLWSDITTFSNFSAGLSPMPILLYTEVIPAGLPGHNAYNGFLIPADNARLNGTYYEATPFEVGSWQGRASAFVKTNYLGTRFDNGQPINDTCVNGFETAAFMVGAVDAAMNFWVASVQSNGTVGQFAKRSHESKTKVPYPPHEDKIEQERLASSFVDMVGELPRYVQAIGNPRAEEAVYGLWPNPFQNSSSADAYLRTQKLLWITDGSEYGQENPIVPLIQKARTPDFIVVNDAGGAELSSGWMNGTSFVNTADWAKHNGLPFPKVPSVNTILNLNHTLFPTFYGCHEKDVPLILYAADAPYTEYSNITAIDTAESSLEQHVRLWNNTLNIYSQPKNLRPHITTDLPTCIACGSILRSLQRLHKPVPDACKKCFKEHCWDGKEDHSQPGFLAPALLYDPEVSFAQWNASFYASATTNSTGNSSSSGL